LAPGDWPISDSAAAQESFGVQQAGDKLVVPANCIDRWFIKFTERFRWVL